SREGLAGWHGSVATGGASLYYAVTVFSEKGNGIAAFDEPWKNVVASLYHELQEVRTNPDVGPALRRRDPALLGWMSQRGGETGDAPLDEDGPPLAEVMREVPLADGSGAVPVQLLWSNEPRAAAPVPAVAVRVAAEPTINWIGQPATD